MANARVIAPVPAARDVVAGRAISVNVVLMGAAAWVTFETRAPLPRTGHGAAPMVRAWPCSSGRCGSEVRGPLGRRWAELLPTHGRAWRQASFAIYSPCLCSHAADPSRATASENDPETDPSGPRAKARAGDGREALRPARDGRRVRSGA